MDLMQCHPIRWINMEAIVKMDLMHINLILFTTAVLLQIVVIIYSIRIWKITRRFEISKAWIIFAFSMALISGRRFIFLIASVQGHIINGHVWRFVEAIMLLIASIAWLWFMRIKYRFYHTYLEGDALENKTCLYKKGREKK